MRPLLRPGEGSERIWPPRRGLPRPRHGHPPRARRGRGGMGPGRLSDRRPRRGRLSKAVHARPLGGARLVDDAVLAAMEDFAFVAPAHNPPYVAAMRAFRCLAPSLPQVALFETAFFNGLGEATTTWAIPYELDAGWACGLLRLPRREPPRGQRACPGRARPSTCATSPATSAAARASPPSCSGCGCRHELRPLPAVRPAPEQPGGGHGMLRCSVRHEVAEPRRRRDGAGARERSSGPRRHQRRLGGRARPRRRRRRWDTPPARPRRVRGGGPALPRCLPRRPSAAWTC